MALFKLFLLAFALFFAVNVSAQLPKKTVKKASVITFVVKFKPPAVKTLLGKNEKEATVTIDEANQLVNFPLKVIDTKNNVYAISSYQFMYKKKSVIENEETGRKEIVFTASADLFKITPLPKIWRDNIGGGIQKDEQLYFFDVIVNDKQNRKFFAPNLKIIVK